MNRYLSRLVLLVVVLVAMAGAVAAHYLLTDSSGQINDVADIVKITGISQPSLSVSWYEPRMISDAILAQNPAYPELEPIQRSDFFYAH